MKKYIRVEHNKQGFVVRGTTHDAIQQLSEFMSMTLPEKLEFVLTETPDIPYLLGAQDLINEHADCTILKEKQDAEYQAELLRDLVKHFRDNILATIAIAKNIVDKRAPEAMKTLKRIETDIKDSRYRNLTMD